jgi:hypothetical protein
VIRSMTRRVGTLIGVAAFLLLSTEAAYGQGACCIAPPGKLDASPAMILVWELGAKESLESLQKRVARLPGVKSVKVCSQNLVLAVEFDEKRQTASRIAQFIRNRGVRAAVHPQCCLLPG